MKKTKVIIPALGILLLSTAASVTGTVAWFSANSTVYANGMQVKAKAESALVISNALAVGTATEVNFTTAASTLVPATHNSTIAVGDSMTFASATGLKYNTNPSAVNPATGLANTGEDDPALTFGDVLYDDKGIYSADYVVFIAAAGTEHALASGEKLQVKLSVSEEVYGNLDKADGSYDTWNALSVDFYVSEDQEATGVYAGTLNLAKSGLSDSTFENVTPVNLLTTGTIPQNNKPASAADFLKITMRVYFDGDLKKTGSSTQAYVYSDRINVNEISFNATFKLA